MSWASKLWLLTTLLNVPDCVQELWHDDEKVQKLCKLDFLKAGFTMWVNICHSDFQTAYNNYMALKDFFAGFPEFAANDFYVTGESYAGVYVPMLSELVMNDPEFNFKVTNLL